MKPLAAVTTLDGLELRDIPLTTLDGLGSLQSANLSIGDMPLLTSLNGLGPFASGSIALMNLALLGSLQGLGPPRPAASAWSTSLLVDSLASLGAFTDGQSIEIRDSRSSPRSQASTTSSRPIR